MRGRTIGLVVMILSMLQLHAQVKRFDSSMKLGKAGYRVVCSNKNLDKNYTTIHPIGFQNGAHEVSIEVKGRILRAEVDDLNNDGFPDLVLYVYSSGAKNMGTVVGISSDKNEGFVPILFPDLLDDLKLRAGYTGNDEFSLMEGTLMRKFPVYNIADTTRPAGIMRQIQYRVVPGDRGIQKFKVSRSYEVKQ